MNNFDALDGIAEELKNVIKTYSLEGAGWRSCKLYCVIIIKVIKIKSIAM